MEIKNPFFSIIIPTYNRAHSIEKAIKSVLEQSFQDFEIIVVDDASADSTQEVVTSILDPRINFIRNTVNLERCVSRNIGIEKAKGQYICFLDSDDYHLANHLEKIYKKVQEKKEPEGFFFTNAWNESVEGERSERECPVFEQYDPFTYFLHYTVNPQRWAVHRSVFTQISFDPEVVICEDMDTSLRIAAAGFPIYHINERTTVYVAAADSFTVSDSRKWEKELFYLQKIFKRKELEGKLKKKETNRLLSMCFYHLALKSFAIENRLETLRNALNSYFLCPSGYNGKTRKSTLTMVVYSLPLLGYLLKAFVRFVK